MSKITKNYQFKLHTFQRGGSDPDVVLTPEKVIDKAAGFPSTVDDSHAYDYLATFQSYDVLPRPASANPIEIENQKEVIERLGLARLQYLKALDNIDYVLSNHDEFVTFNLADLNTQANALKDSINKITKAASPASATTSSAACRQISIRRLFNCRRVCKRTEPMQ